MKCCCDFNLVFQQLFHWDISDLIQITFTFYLVCITTLNKKNHTLCLKQIDQVCSMSPESLFQVCLEEWSVCWQQSLCANEQGALGKHLDTWGKTNVLQQGTRYSPGAGSSCLVALIVDVLGGHHSNTKMVKKNCFYLPEMIHLMKIQGCLCVWCSTHWALHCINHISHCRCN